MSRRDPAVPGSARRVTLRALETNSSLCPRDLDATPSVLAPADVRSSVVTSVRALGEASRPPVEQLVRAAADARSGRGPA
jgi:hypothetical protein